MKKHAEIVERLNNITYIDLDEFLAIDIFDLERGLRIEEEYINGNIK